MQLLFLENRSSAQYQGALRCQCRLQPDEMTCTCSRCSQPLPGLVLRHSWNSPPRKRSCTRERTVQSRTEMDSARTVVPIQSTWSVRCGDGGLSQTLGMQVLGIWKPSDVDRGRDLIVPVCGTWQLGERLYKTYTWHIEKTPTHVYLQQSSSLRQLSSARSTCTHSCISTYGRYQVVLQVGNYTPILACVRNTSTILSAHHRR